MGRGSGADAVTRASPRHLLTLGLAGQVIQIESSETYADLSNLSGAVHLPASLIPCGMSHVVS